MKWSANAPANIALIKYMGKLDGNKNLPLNASLSYTLDHCRSFVEIEINKNGVDVWQPLEIKNGHPMQLSEAGKSRFLQHLKLLKNHFNCNSYFLIKSANNFPADCGLASSASSYAALTKAACLAMSEIMQIPALSTDEMAHLSQLGSGSSCRSFYQPWCIWRENTVKPVELHLQKLLHQVVVINKEKKLVSSSEAHKRVQTSALYLQRKQRSEQRLTELLHALSHNHWQQSYLLCWQEFWDMHALFETSGNPFGYMTDGSLNVLNTIRSYWEKFADGPLVTMDAGPNVHLLYREDQIDLANTMQKMIQLKFTVIKNYESY